MKPLLKWAGGKRHIADVLESHLPSDWDQGFYYEPFLGGAALYLHLDPKNARLSDLNSPLIGLYLAVKQRPRELFHYIQAIAEEFDEVPAEEKKGHYLLLRRSFNNSSSPLEKSALLYVLNKLCFNGLYRENSKGEFNVPFGNKKKFPVPVLSDFEEISQRFKTASLSVSDFETAVSTAEKGDFVYFDPPYIPLRETASFTAYSKGGFDLDAQRRLAKTMIELSERGVKAMLSNSYTPDTMEIYAGMRLEIIEAPRMVSAKSQGRGMVNEVLILNYEK